MTQREYDPKRLQELIIYLAEKSAGDARFGMTKLNKMLFFADFRAYLRTGQSITGAVYHHLGEGPVPHQMLPCLESLKRQNAIIEKHDLTYGGTQRRVVALREANLERFTGTEIAIADQVVAELAPLTNIEASKLSHEEMAWRLTHERQEVPYDTAYLSSDPPSEEDELWLEKVAVSGSMGAS
jgi:hypothetical protein